MQSEAVTNEGTTDGAREAPEGPYPERASSAPPSRNDLLSHLVAIGLGATAMYLLDPERGKRRRHAMGDRIAHAAKEASAARLLAGVAGGALATATLRADGRLNSRKAALGLIGTALVVRSVTNMPFERLVGVGVGGRAVTVRTAITIAAPIDDVFNWLAAWERWPHWMSHVRKVRSHEGSGAVGERTHWLVDGPGGTTVEWDAETMRFVPPTLIAWRTVEGSPVAHAGMLTLARTDAGATRLAVELTYIPAAGPAGQALAALLRRDPRCQLDDDLARLKTTIETGRPPRDAAIPSRLPGAEPA
jgi:uncharacterized membrane protein